LYFDTALTCQPAGWFRGTYHKCYNDRMPQCDNKDGIKPGNVLNVWLPVALSLIGPIVIGRDLYLLINGKCRAYSFEPCGLFRPGQYSTHLLRQWRIRRTGRPL